MDRQTPDHELRALLTSAQRIAVVGLSPKKERASNMVGRYLQQQDYIIYPVNPGHDEILGVTCYRELGDIDEPVDIVNIFRRPEDTPGVVEEAIKIGARSIWMQQGIVNEEAAALAKEAGIPCYMDLCIKVEHDRLITT